MTRSKKKDRFDGKRKLYPRSTSRLPLFCRVLSSTTKAGEIKILKGQELTQTHRDLLEAIATIGKRGTYKDGIRQFYVFTPYDVLKFLGFSNYSGDAYKWLKEKLSEIRSVNVELKYEDKYGKYKLIGGIIDQFGYCKIKREKENPTTYGETYFGVVFSEAFSILSKQDIIVWAKPEITKAIVDMKYDFLKAVVRFCLTHEQVNMNFEDLLKHMGLKIADRTKRKFKALLIAEQEYLKQHFGISVVKKGKEILIFYKKNPDAIALDYQNSNPDPENDPKK